MFGFTARIRAATPATCGVAMLVPTRYENRLSPLTVVRPPLLSSSTGFAGQLERIPCWPVIELDADPKAATETRFVPSANPDFVPSYFADVTTRPRSKPAFGPVPFGWSHSSG